MAPLPANDQSSAPPASGSAAPASRSGYRRLPGRMPIFRLISFSTSSLWLGDEHLLQIQSLFHTERYQRFAYGDIRALLLRETARGLIASIVPGVLAAAFLALLVGTTQSNPVRWVLLGAALSFILLTLASLLRGGTCVCHLQSATGSWPLPSLARRRPALRALRLIAERVEAVQGALPPDVAAQETDKLLAQMTAPQRPQAMHASAPGPNAW